MFNIFKNSSPEEKKTEANSGSGRTEAEIAQAENGDVNAAHLPAPSGPEAMSDQENRFPRLPDDPTTPSPSPQVERPSQPVPPFPSKPERRGLFYHLLSSETRTGRFMRPLLRWLAAITGLFALGLLAGYFLLYQPAQNQLDSALVKLNEMNQSISQKDKTQLSAQTDRDQALKNLKQAQDDLNKAASENDLLVVFAEVNSVRVALVNKDGQSAKIQIDQAQISLVRAQVYINTQDKTRGDLLQTRLDLASKELVSDPQAALADLDKLAADLTELRQKLFKK